MLYYLRLKNLIGKPTKKDIQSVFVGLGPLAAPQGGRKKTKEISRSHKIIVSDSGLVTIIGGKWTTFRGMGQDTIDKIIELKKVSPVSCKTMHLKIHGYDENINFEDGLIFKDQINLRY